ncbi:hypothetical protein OAE00_00600 [bacterium]|nr:hypothetical protein [bacterium]
MFIRFFLLSILVGSSLNGMSQKSIHKTYDLFFSWGYNRAAYTKSDFNISGVGYDLTFKDVRAEDYVTTFSLENYFKPANLTIPQYVGRLGMYLNERTSISIGVDHMKYYMILNQNLEIEGQISPQASEKYADTYNNTSHDVPFRFLYFHHSDGLNYANIEIEYNFPLWTSLNMKHSWEVVGNLGIGLVVPKTYVMILNDDVDNRFHIAGGGISAKVGTRFNFFKYFYIEAASKNGFVVMPNVLVNNEKNATANQRFGWTQFYGALGFNISLSRKEKDNVESP